MAKKVVADFKTSNTAKFAKVIKMIKSKKGLYKFVEEIVATEKVSEYLEK